MTLEEIIIEKNNELKHRLYARNSGKTFQFIKEVAIAYAKQKCKEQREVCATEAGHKKHSP